MYQFNAKMYTTKHDCVGNLSLENCGKIELFPYNEMVHAQTKIPTKQYNTSISGFWDTDRSPALGSKISLGDCLQHKRIYCIMDLLSRWTTEWSPRETKTETCTWSLLENWENLRNMKVTVIPIITDALGTVPDSLKSDLEELETRGWIKDIQTTALLRSTRLLRRVVETRRNLLSLRLHWKPSGNARVKTH